MKGNKIISKENCCDCFYCEGYVCSHKHSEDCVHCELWTPIWARNPVELLKQREGVRGCF